MDEYKSFSSFVGRISKQLRFSKVMVPEAGEHNLPADVNGSQAKAQVGVCVKKYQVKSAKLIQLGENRGSGGSFGLGRINKTK